MTFTAVSCARRAILFTLPLLALAASAFGAEPAPWQLGFQDPASPVQARIDALHDWLLILITLITLFVLALLLIVIVRFNAQRNPTPTRTAHNTVLELAWTIIPVFILGAIAVPSFALLYYVDKTQEADMTVKVTGKQWYWTYEYPDHGNISFDSLMVPENELKPGQKRLLEVDRRLVVPTGANVRVLVAGADVMHSWFIPSLGVQQYSVVGRLNETWLRIDKEGVYYGQCNQICGVNHAYMPIAVEAVSPEAFRRWVDQNKTAAAPRAVTAEAATAAGRQ